MQKVSPDNFLPLPRNRQKTEMISLIYDVNDHVCSNSKSMQLFTDLAIEGTRIVTLS